MKRRLTLMTLLGVILTTACLDQRVAVFDLPDASVDADASPDAPDASGVPWHQPFYSNRVAVTLPASIEGGVFEDVTLPLQLSEALDRSSGRPDGRDTLVVDESGARLDARVGAWSTAKLLWVRFERIDRAEDTTIYVYTQGPEAHQERQRIYSREATLTAHHFLDFEQRTDGREDGYFFDAAELGNHDIVARDAMSGAFEVTAPPWGRAMRLSPGFRPTVTNPAALLPFANAQRTYSFYLRSDVLDPTTTQRVFGLEGPCDLHLDLRGNDLRARLDSAESCPSNASSTYALDASLPDGTFLEWTHVVLTVDRVAEQVKLYVDGVEVASLDAFRPDTDYTDAANMRIGHDWVSNTLEADAFVGALDMFQVALGAWSPARVALEHAALSKTLFVIGQVEARP